MFVDSHRNLENDELVSLYSNLVESLCNHKFILPQLPVPVSFNENVNTQDFCDFVNEKQNSIDVVDIIKIDDFFISNEFDYVCESIAVVSSGLLHIQISERLSTFDRVIIFPSVEYNLVGDRFHFIVDISIQGV